MVKWYLCMWRSLGLSLCRTRVVNILCNNFLKLTGGILRPEDATVGCDRKLQHHWSHLNPFRGQRPPWLFVVMWSWSHIWLHNNWTAPQLQQAPVPRAMTQQRWELCFNLLVRYVGNTSIIVNCLLNWNSARGVYYLCLDSNPLLLFSDISGS